VKRVTSGHVFDIFNHLFMVLLILAMLYPFLNTVAVSFSGYFPVVAGEVKLWPVGFQIQSYQNVFGDPRFQLAFKNTVIVTIGGTLICTVMTMIFAYGLSKRALKGRDMIMKILIFLMIFGGGGFIPNYLLMKELHLINTFWALWLPSAISVWNTIIFKNFFQQLPQALEESAEIDGASAMRILFWIVIPTSMPVIAAIALFNAVGAWNTFFNALVYLSDKDMILLQVFLRDVVQSIETPMARGEVEIVNQDNIASDSVKAATIICSTLPILFVYPFLQKYFVKGIMLGSIKG
jgi:putative aldouronate transport system permease protein